MVGLGLEVSISIPMPQSDLGHYSVSPSPSLRVISGTKKEHKHSYPGLVDLIMPRNCDLDERVSGPTSVPWGEIAGCMDGHQQGVGGLEGHTHIQVTRDTQSIKNNQNADRKSGRRRVGEEPKFAARTMEISSYNDRLQK
ncbi:hypothetical protein MAR_011089 [Mya arenaria]|uniref:Uncharacterized protein n=1 Tax=Mya arenaria TaxID=6604 RepID=A0ABY7FT49_MYAAR|nr:hypothetical protein MAR_011089 [Mya arenaria]